MTEREHTDFGYQRIAADTKPGRVQQLFDSVAPNYDLMNDLMSLGLHRLWKREAIELSGVRPGHLVLDIASGTGDLSLLLGPLVGEQGRVIQLDPTVGMLQQGRDRALDAGLLQCADAVCARSEQLPFADAIFDCICCGFGLRNFTDKATALTEIRRCLKPGGRLLVLEFSRPTNPLISKLYDFYSFSILPILGQRVAGDADAYRYLAESIRMHPDQEMLLGLLRDCGLTDCDYHNLLNGIVAIHRGFALADG